MEPHVRFRPNHYRDGHAFGVSPRNPNEIFLSNDTEGRRYTYQGSPLYFEFESRYSSSGTYHPDIEALVPHPTNANEVWMSHHGGVSVSTDNGLTWADRSMGLGVAQPFRMATGASDPSSVALGLFHDGSIGTASPWHDFWSPTWNVFQSSFCDGLLSMIDPVNSQYMWHSCAGGNWYRSTNKGSTFSANGPNSPTWVVDAAFNRLDPRIQYRLSADSCYRYPAVMRTFDHGGTWDQITDFQGLLYPAAKGSYTLLRRKPMATPCWSIWWKT